MINKNQGGSGRLTSEEVRALKSEQEQRRQAQEAGCTGLLGRLAFSAKRRQDISADLALHEDGPFICRGCLSDAVLRKCTEKCDHYAHHARTTPAIVSGETELHQNCLQEILDQLKRRYPNGNWEKNRRIEADKIKGFDEVVPDISGRLGDRNSQPLVIEAQVSFLSIHQIIKRSIVYTKRRIPILWIVPLKEKLVDQPFRPRLYERYLHTMYFGRVYYWCPGSGTRVIPVHYGVAKRHIPFSEWYDKEAAERREVGGYDKIYKVIKRPVIGSEIDMVLQFESTQREEFRPWNERKIVPPLKIWRDKCRVWWDRGEDDIIPKIFKEDNLEKGREKPPRRVRKFYP
jgi:competence protein CoiA